MTRAAVRIGAETYEPLPPFFVALAVYLPIVFVLVCTATQARAQDGALDGARTGMTST